MGLFVVRKLVSKDRGLSLGVKGAGGQGRLKQVEELNLQV